MVTSGTWGGNRDYSESFAARLMQDGMDLDGHTTGTGGTIPVTVCVTPLKPDVTIIDKKKNTFNIFELNCPMEPTIKKRNSEKFRKYSHFMTDITCYTPTLTCFEIGSRGYVSPENHARLKTLHSIEPVLFLCHIY